jgi:GNAT superfamily N-acetyltransferase
VLRAPSASDLPVILDAWLQELRHAPWSMRMTDDEYFPAQRQLILYLLRVAQSTIACAEDDPDHVYGFVVHGPATAAGTPVLHWLQVKSAYRGVGLGRRLLHAVVPAALERGGPRFFATAASRLATKRLADLSSRGMVYAPVLLTSLLLETKHA